MEVLGIVFLMECFGNCFFNGMFWEFLTFKWRSFPEGQVKTGLTFALAVVPTYVT